MYMNLYKKFAFSGTILLMLIIIIQGCGQPSESVREIKLINSGWQFHIGEVDEAYAVDFDDSGWRRLNLPHDWSIEGEFNEQHPAGVGGGALPGGIGWYRKSFVVPESDSGKIISITFDGIYRNSEVWINGDYLGKRPNGYISFQYNMTPHLVYGKENVITVRVDNSEQPNSRWYSGSGIYRKVQLVKTNPLHIKNWGTFITTPEITDSHALVSVQTEILNQFEGNQNFELRTTIYDQMGREASSVITENLAVSDTVTIQQEMDLQVPERWSPEHPYLYTAVTEIIQNDEIVDDYETRFGVRDFHFDADKGFFLNGERVKILGVCEHHDLGALGAAVNKRAIERRLEILKDMGVNAIRTAHNPPSKELLELTDEMGFIVMDEIFDSWKRNKTVFGYYQDWDDWYEKDLKDFIRRDRNHPSVIMWSIGNEIIEQWHPEGEEMAKELASIVRELDNTRPITSGMNNPTPENYLVQSGALDIIGFNYHEEWFAEFPENFPGEKMIGAETTSALGTRGEYHMPSDSIRRWPEAWDKPFEDGNEAHTVSSYDNVSAPWGSTHEETWREVKRADHVSGMFIWTGFDYLGEPTPYGWPSRSSYFGVMDLAGFPKDVFYMYQSEWTDKEVLHVFPHWNWEGGKVVDVWAYSSTDEVELFLNGESLGRKSKPDSSFHIMWRVDYEPGTLKAIAYKEDGTTISKEVVTAGEPAKISLIGDRTKLIASGRDLSFIRVEILDKDGNFVPKASNQIEFEISGPGFIAGVDNGDPTSMESFKANHRKAFNGLAQVIIQTEETPGVITVKALSEGLETGQITLQSNN